MKKINVLISTFFGYGYLTKIPGTVASFVTTIFIYIAFEILNYTDLKFSIILFAIAEPVKFKCLFSISLILRSSLKR